MGASVRGPANAFKKKLKQDAWRIFHRKWGILAVVCDGLGSKKDSRIGAIEGCLAVNDMINDVLINDPESNPLDHLSLIEKYWLKRVYPLDPLDCMTTCLFCLLTPKGWIGAQMGDGLLAFRSQEGQIYSCQPSKESVFNFTSCLGAQEGGPEWQKLGPYSPESIQSLLLATDGVSDDIPKSQITSLLKSIVQEYRSMSGAERYQHLRNELINWPTPHHLDDKTLLAIWSEK